RAATVELERVLAGLDAMHVDVGGVTDGRGVARSLVGPGCARRPAQPGRGRTVARQRVVARVVERATGFERDAALDVRRVPPRAPRGPAPAPRGSPTSAFHRRPPGCRLRSRSGW